jgi:[ribosomal protein S5]-alanine N-acetyltransferase
MTILTLVLIERFKSENFEFRNLVSGGEDNHEYLSWMTNTNDIFIEGIREDFSILKLNEYISEKNYSSNAILIGVFSLQGNHHVGNVKFEPIDFKLNNAWMGILIGNSSFRGKGFSSEIITTTCSYLSSFYNISEFFLGVDPTNHAALHAYKKCEFKVVGSHQKGGIIMLRRFSNTP